MPYNPGNWGVYAQSLQSLGQAGSDAGGSIGDAIASIGERKKNEAKMAKTLRSFLGTVDPENKETYEAMGLAQLQGKADAMAVNRAKELHDQRVSESQQLMKMRRQQFRADRTKRQRLADFNAAIAERGLPESINEFAKLAAEFNQLSPDAVGDVIDSDRGLTPGQRVDLGGGKYGIANSRSSIQIFDEPTQPVSEPTEVVLPDGRSSGWALFPDGDYRRLPEKPDTIDAAQFDTDNDGVLSIDEWRNALVAQRHGGLAPGMRVGSGAGSRKADAQAKPQSLWERVQQLRGK